MVIFRTAWNLEFIYYAICLFFMSYCYVVIFHIHPAESSKVCRWSCVSLLSWQKWSMTSNVHKKKNDSKTQFATGWSWFGSRKNWDHDVLSPDWQTCKTWVSRSWRWSDQIVPSVVVGLPGYIHREEITVVFGINCLSYPPTGRNTLCHRKYCSDVL